MGTHSETLWRRLFSGPQNDVFIPGDSRHCPKIPKSLDYVCTAPPTPVMIFHRRGRPQKQESVRESSSSSRCSDQEKNGGGHSAASRAARWSRLSVPRQPRKAPAKSGNRKASDRTSRLAPARDPSQSAPRQRRSSARGPEICRKQDGSRCKGASVRRFRRETVQANDEDAAPAHQRLE